MYILYLDKCNVIKLKTMSLVVHSHPRWMDHGGEF